MIYMEFTSYYIFQVIYRWFEVYRRICMVLCKYYTALYQRTDHLWILGSTWGCRTKACWLLKPAVFHFAKFPNTGLLPGTGSSIWSHHSFLAWDACLCLTFKALAPSDSATVSLALRIQQNNELHHALLTDKHYTEMYSKIILHTSHPSNISNNL